MKINVFDVANYIIETCPSVTNMKLQSLVYYAYAYHLVQFNKPLIQDFFEAWVYGPVLRDLYLEFNRYSYKAIQKTKKR